MQQNVRRIHVGLMSTKTMCIVCSWTGEDSENNQDGHWLKTMMMCFVRKNQPDGKGKGFWERRDEMKDWNDNEKDRI